MLSFFKRHQVLALSLSLIIIAPFFFIGGPTVYSSLLFCAIWDCGHLLFFVLLVAFLQVQFDFSHWRAILWLTLVVFVVGGLIEIIQAHTGRDGNWGDLLRDLAGTWLGVFWLQRANKWIWYGRLIATALILPSLMVVVLSGWAQVHAEKQFPMLADFESAIELQHFNGKFERTTEHHSRGEYALKIHLTTKKYSGVNFNEFLNSWNGFQWLCFDIYIPDPEPLVLTLRVHDKAHELGVRAMSDRFNKPLQLAPGWNHIEISLDDIRHAPTKREMDLDSISTIVIYAGKLPAPRDIYLDNMYLQ